MKKIICYILLVLGIAAGLSSCTKNFTEMNTDPNNPPTALPKNLFAPAMVKVLNHNMRKNWDFTNELMQVTVNMGDEEGKVFRYDFRASVADRLYNGLYIELSNLKEIYKISSDESGSNKGNYNKTWMGISLICQSWVYSILTDTYGNVPYFQSNQARDDDNFEPAFDSQKEIYLDIFKKLEAANTLLGGSDAPVVEGDPIYSGDPAAWRRFGNALYLRLLLRVSGKSEVAANCIAKIKEIAETNTAGYPIFTQNEHSAVFKWTGSAPFISPMAIEIREQDYRAPSVCEFFIENLKDWSDPRISIPTWGTNGYNRWGIAIVSGNYTGVPSGYTPGSNPVRKSYFYSMTNPNSMQTEPLSGMMLNYPEVKFMLAEAALKGWINNDAGRLYTEGAENSIKLWLPNWNESIDKFLSDADIEWIDALTFDEKMERIHLQKYYALWLVDMQQWIEYRRTGHPILPKGPGLKNDGVMPARMNYPVYVQSANPTNYKKAIAEQGPDLISTEVWWQKQ